MENFIETNRLILREMLFADEQGMFELDADPDVHLYLGNNPVKTIAESRAVITAVRQQYAEYGIGRWTVIEKSSDDFIGWAGLKFITENCNNHSNYYDVGYRFIKRYWGKGYAKESAIGAVRYGFDVLNLNELYGMADVENIASNKVLQKAGLKYIENFDHHGIRHSWYKLAKEDRR